MRGNNSIYKKVIINEPISKKQPSLKIGRNADLVDERNAVMCYRYYFYSNIHRNRYEDCIEKLHKEFFLSKARIITILTGNCAATIKAIHSEAPTIRNLSNKIPYLNWNI